MTSNAATGCQSRGLAQPSAGAHVKAYIFRHTQSQTFVMANDVRYNNEEGS